MINDDNDQVTIENIAIKKDILSQRMSFFVNTINRFVNLFINIY